MNDDINPDKVRALLDNAGPEEWHLDNGLTAEYDPETGECIGYAPTQQPSILTPPTGAPDDGGDLIAVGFDAGGMKLALMAESKRIAAAYLAVCEERDRLRADRDRLSAWLSRIEGGDNPCVAAATLRWWAYEAVTLGREVSDG